MRTRHIRIRFYSRELFCGSNFGSLGRCGRICRSGLFVRRNVDQFDFELQSLVGTDVTACAACTVSQVGGNPERDRTALAYQLQALGPSRNHTVYTELSRFTTFYRAIECSSIQ